jgi:hypothetical protein
MLTCRCTLYAILERFPILRLCVIPLSALFNLDALLTAPVPLTILYTALTTAHSWVNSVKIAVQVFSVFRSFRKQSLRPHLVCIACGTNDEEEDAIARRLGNNATASQTGF